MTEEEQQTEQQTDEDLLAVLRNIAARVDAARYARRQEETGRRQPRSIVQQIRETMAERMEADWEDSVLANMINLFVQLGIDAWFVRRSLARLANAGPEPTRKEILSVLVLIGVAARRAGGAWEQGRVTAERMERAQRRQRSKRKARQAKAKMVEDLLERANRARVHREEAQRLQAAEEARARFRDAAAKERWERTGPEQP